MDGWKLPWVHFTFRCISIFVVFFLKNLILTLFGLIFRRIYIYIYIYIYLFIFVGGNFRGFTWNWVVGQYLKFVDLILLNDLFLLSMPFVMLCIAFRGVSNVCSFLYGIWTRTIDTLQHQSLSFMSSALDHSTTSAP
jgi:hypothetical protein